MDLDKFKERASSLASKAQEKYGEYSELRAKSSQELVLKLVSKGFLGDKPIFIRKNVGGQFYLAQKYIEQPDLFTFENLEFEGSTIIQNTTTNGKQQGRAGSALLGAAIAGPAGAVIGGSRKKKYSSNSTTSSSEKPGRGKVFLRNTLSRQIKTIEFQATQAEFNNIERFFIK